MRHRFSPATVLIALLLAGCVRDKSSPADVPGFTGVISNTSTNSTGGEKLIVTESLELKGKVSSVNTSLRFVVLTFPVGQMPALNKQFSLYRRGLKVGEATITGPQRDDSIVADLVSGEAETDDEVREK